MGRNCGLFNIWSVEWSSDQSGIRLLILSNAIWMMVSGMGLPESVFLIITIGFQTLLTIILLESVVDDYSYGKCVILTDVSGSVYLCDNRRMMVIWLPCIFQIHALVYVKVIMKRRIFNWAIWIYPVMGWNILLKSKLV